MEIEFRGKRVDNGEWVKGYYFAEWWSKKLEHYIRYELSGDFDEVIPETVGQFTGQKVKNQKLFADDIIMSTMSDGAKIYKLVVWDSEYMGFGLQNLPINKWESVQHFCNNDNYLDRFDIVGNKWDNIDLMGAGK